MVKKCKFCKRHVPDKTGYCSFCRDRPEYVEDNHKKKEKRGIFSSTLMDF